MAVVYVASLAADADILYFEDFFGTRTKLRLCHSAIEFVDFFLLIESFFFCKKRNFYFHILVD